MILNINFKNRLKLESIIAFSPALCAWFERNQEWMAYFELTHAGCTQFEDDALVSYDIKVLGRMANACFSWLECQDPVLGYQQKAVWAANAIHEIYVAEKENLSDTAKELYAIYAEKQEIAKNDAISLKRCKNPKNGIKNNRPGKGHRKH